MRNTEPIDIDAPNYEKDNVEFKRYCLGFMFSEDKKQVALIKKNRPEWQKDKYNGMGGLLKENEFPLQAMKREFLEEAGYENGNWNNLTCLLGKDYSVFVYYSTGDLTKLKSITDEEVEAINIDEIKINCDKVVSNVPWLISMCLNRLNGEWFNFYVSYR